MSEPWAWCVIEDGKRSAPWAVDQWNEYAIKQWSETAARYPKRVQLVQLYPLPDALRGMDPEAVARVVEAAKKAAAELEGISKYDSYYFLSAGILAKELRAALSALAPGKEDQ